MLNITRKPGQKIMIGDDIVITLIKISHGQAELGIEAPRSIPVHRQEIYEAIQSEKLDNEE